MNSAADTIGGGRDALGATSGRMVALARLGIGLAQGIVLYLLMRTTEGDGATWSSRNPELFAAMLLPALFLPPVLLAGVGRLRIAILAAWAGVAATVLAGLAWHDIARQSGMDREPTFPLFAFSAVALFIAHHLILPADRERRLIASFAAYFDAAWMAGVQLAASIAFAGVFWLLLFLGAALFNVIGLRFLGELLRQGWFFLPLTGLAFATAVHLTDVRDGLIRGVRTIALMLLSWLLLVLTVLVGAFLIALPFTGLDGLWETGSATALVLSAVGVMIVLINAAYQDGRPENLPPAVLRVAVQVAAVLLVPLVGIAVWGLALRIGQHGLTPDRIIAAACALIGALHAGGYAHAAAATLRSGTRWMAPLERTNIAGAVASVLAILALFSPVADPARLSVADQMARLERGQVAADRFDYDFLQQSSGKTGHAALARLAASDDPVIAARAKAAQDQIVFNDPSESQDVRPIIDTLDGAPALPEPFFEIVGETEDARSDCRAPGDCLAVLGPSLGFPQGDVLLVQAGTVTVFSEDAEYGTYWSRGYFVPVVCGGRPAVDARDLLRQGRLRAADHSRPALETGSGVPAELVASARPRC
ncbi:MAG: DUF4153 domain-containing protein [Brevundimonas sp. 12-68-7]|nr:MAG: DUF4153 domain-containing protein [Brevundimonas sp. 12-68-7]OYX36025.1 MAG: DUF4153 domain-containing protein [Brevundimonas subvibrioides]